MKYSRLKISYAHLLQNSFLFLFTFSLISSCTHNQISLSLISLNSELKKVCLDGEGTGRVRYSGQNNLFDYESALFSSEQWRFGLEIPAMGTEILDFHFANARLKSIKGSFYRRLMQASRGKSQTEQRYVREALHGLGFFISLVAKVRSTSSMPKSCSSKNSGEIICLLGKQRFIRFFKKAPTSLEAIYTGSGAARWAITLTGKSAGGYERIKVAPHLFQENGGVLPPFELNLFVDSCN